MLCSRVIEEIGRDGAREKEKGENEKVCVCVCVCVRENGTPGNLVCSKGKKRKKMLYIARTRIYFFYIQVTK